MITSSTISFTIIRRFSCTVQIFFVPLHAIIGVTLVGLRFSDTVTPSIHWHPDTVVFLLINTVVASFFQDVAQMSKTIIYEFINKKIICIIDYWCDISTAGDSKWVTGN